MTTSATGIELSVNRVCERVLDNIEQHRRAWVTGDVGSGRATLARALLECRGGEDGRAAWVDLLDLREADAIIGGLFSATGWLSDAGARESCLQDWPSMRAAVKTFADKAGKDFTLIVTVPRSWSTARLREDAHAHVLAERASGFLHGLTSVDLCVVLITPRSMQPSTLGDDELSAIALSPPKNTLALLGTQTWGTYQEAAERLGDALDDGLEPSPVHLRLAVGAVALGANASSVALNLERPRGQALRLLVDELLDQLSLDERRGLRRAVTRQLIARRPLPRNTVSMVTDIPDEHLPLLTECIGYGGERVRVSSNVRRMLSGRLLAHERDEELLTSTHRDLVKHYTSLDGASQITQTQGFATTAWLEKMHHLARVEPTEVDQLPCRELYWERGRELSIHRKDFAAAAAVYEACVARFPDDAYAQHYLGFNLERAGQRRADANSAYRAAIDRDPTNPWWNARLVTFLVGQGRLSSARTAWVEAVDRVDPDGERTSDGPWLAEHFHLWVCRAWLEAGSPADAFEVLQGVPDEIIERSSPMDRLRQRVLDAVESDALGGSVYPASYPIAERWVEPSFLGESVKEWFPGRVLGVDDGLRVFYGTRDGRRYRSQVTTFAEEFWKKLSARMSLREGDYVVLGRQSDGTPFVEPQPQAQPETQPETLPKALPLAYFDRWRSQT